MIWLSTGGAAYSNNSLCLTSLVFLLCSLPSPCTALLLCTVYTIISVYIEQHWKYVRCIALLVCTVYNIIRIYSVQLYLFTVYNIISMYGVQHY